MKIKCNDKRLSQVLKAEGLGLVFFYAIPVISVYKQRIERPGTAHNQKHWIKIVDTGP